MNGSNWIRRPDDPALDSLEQTLRQRADALDRQALFDPPQAWPADSLADCAAAGVYRWFIEADCPHADGLGWTPPWIARGYVRLGRACLTTAFVVTQLMGALRRIAKSANTDAATRWLGPLASGERIATVGISHLTTSRRHLGRAVLAAEPVSGGYLLEGYSPWVTGARFADYVVLGAQLSDERQLLACVSTGDPGVQTPAAAELVALGASQTGSVQCKQVFVPESDVLAGPIPNVMASGVGASTGGLQTSALALGLAAQAIDFLDDEAHRRDDLAPAAESLRSQWDAAYNDLLLLASAEADPDRCTPQSLRTRANSLALRAAQAALSSAKGAGFSRNHVAQRWCRESLFFLVWSCPQPVSQANLCELAGIA